MRHASGEARTQGNKIKFCCATITNSFKRMNKKLLTNAKLLDLIYHSATCYVPTDELTEEQLERFDNITYRWCNCRRCKRALKIRDKVIRPQWWGHANKKTLEIRLSGPVLKEHMAVPSPLFLLSLIETTLHEIVHILFPEFNEEQTNEKTLGWLKRNQWVSDLEVFESTAKRQIEKSV